MGGAVSVHAVPGFPIHFRRRPGLGHRVLVVATAVREQQPDTDLIFPVKYQLDPQRAYATGRAILRTRLVGLKSAGNTW